MRNVRLIFRIFVLGLGLIKVRVGSIVVPLDSNPSCQELPIYVCHHSFRRWHVTSPSVALDRSDHLSNGLIHPRPVSAVVRFSVRVILWRWHDTQHDHIGAKKGTVMFVLVSSPLGIEQGSYSPYRMAWIIHYLIVIDWHPLCVADGGWWHANFTKGVAVARFKFLLGWFIFLFLEKFPSAFVGWSVTSLGVRLGAGLMV